MKMFDVTYIVKDKETGEIVQEEHFEWPEAVYRLVLHQTDAAKNKAKRQMGLK
jgi:hypothetical protein